MIHLPVALLCLTLLSSAADDPLLVGYTWFRNDLPGGRHANIRTMRAMVVPLEGDGRRELLPSLVTRPDEWTQFAGWSPDGSTAIVLRGWESPENAAWEEEHHDFRFHADGWRVDSFLVDLRSLSASNVTAVEPVSFYNSGLFFWPNDPTRLGFTALIDGNSHPFRMRLDGTDKEDLTRSSQEFTYGFSSSPDGRRIAYHKAYQVHLADADGSHAVRIDTGHPFNFAPAWSPDGSRVLFLSGEHYDCHPYVVDADGTHLRKLADRQGYRGVVEFLDVPDFHGGSSDVPTWSADGQVVYYTSAVDDRVELFRVDLEGRATRLTDSAPGTTHYHPTPSPDGRWLAYGSRRDGVRQLYMRALPDGPERRLTDLSRGQAALWPHWQRRPGDAARRD